MIMTDLTSTRRRACAMNVGNMNEGDLCAAENKNRSNVVVSQEAMKKKLAIVQDFRFFPKPERLKELIIKETNARFSAYFSGAEKVVFTEEDVIEKDILMSSGFLEWDRRDFHRFI